MSEQQTWQGEYGIETSATPDLIWSIFRDVPGWKTWNAGIEHIEIDGPFAACGHRAHRDRWPVRGRNLVHDEASGTGSIALEADRGPGERMLHR